MRLIGMMDSPYVRRVAVSMHLLDISFDHEPLSVFTDYAAFSRINPVVKAPTLVCDDGAVLSDSSLIIDHIEECARPGRSLLPADARARSKVRATTGLALAACEKAVQIVYEQKRPPTKQHEPWLVRITGQLVGACSEIERALSSTGDLGLAAPTVTSQADVAVAVAWRFIETATTDVIDISAYPVTATLSARMEALPEFMVTRFW